VEANIDARANPKPGTPGGYVHMNKFRGLLVAALAAGGLGVLAPGALASGSAQGPPAGPTSPPFYQCPAIGLDTTCQFLVDVTNSGTSVLQDTSQGFYDGGDDVTVAIQNDSSTPLGSVHLGVAGSGDDAFGLDGDGLCNPGSGPSPDGCPFGPPGNNSSPFDYYGPDTTFAIDPFTEPATPDSGTIDFTTPLQPGQYTYISLEAPPIATPYLAAGNVNDAVTSSLTDTGNPEITGAVIAMPAPADVTDQATLVGPNAAFAPVGAKVIYRVYSNPLCTTQVGEKSEVTIAAEGTLPPSGPIGAALANNAKYYWTVEYAGNEGAHPNTKTISACGNEVMTFGTPPSLPVPAVTTVLTGGGQAGTKITVPTGTAVTDNATVTPPSGQAVSGRLSYEVYTDPTCLPFTQVKGAGEGLTSGSGPASNALTLPSGTYYYQASYSGNGVLAPAVSPCGSEVLTVAAPTPPPPPPPSSLFFPVGNPQFNTRTGQIVVIAQFPAPGTATSTGVVQQGATLARAQEAALIREALAEAARHKSKKCRRGFVKKGKKCLNNAPVVFGTTVQTIPAPGTYSIVINPTSKALAALKAGKKLNVVITTTFQNRAGGAPTAHLQSVFVKLKPKKHSHHRRH
jgi:hypothetical protein